jgi:chloride channel protein, CIC family
MEKTGPPESAPPRADRFVRLHLGFLSRFRISPVQATFALAAAIGGAAAGGAYVFSRLLIWVEKICRLDSTSHLESLGAWLILLPALGGLLAGPLIYFLARETRGGGVADVMEAVDHRGGRIRPSVAAVKTIASALTMGTGGSAGSIGPIVQIGAGAGSTIGRLFRSPPRRLKTLVACGTAGGISAIFNAPFGGIMFSLEVVLREFRGLSFIYVAIAAVVSALISRAVTGDTTVFAVERMRGVLYMKSHWEILAFLGLGAFTAFVAKTFNFFLDRFDLFFTRLKAPEFLKPAGGGLAVGLIAYYLTRLVPVPGLDNPLSVMGVGFNTIRQVLNPDNYAGWMEGGMVFLLLALALVAVLKILATAFTLGSGGSGGIFAPSLVIGAMAGTFYGFLLQAIFPGFVASPAVYALVGMGACFAGSAHAPITAIFILFEMTDSYEVILPIMAAVVVSSLVAFWLKPESNFAECLKRKGIEPRRPKKTDILHDLRTKDVMIRDVQYIPETMTLEELRQKVGKTLHTSLPVVNADDDLVGIITYKQIHLGVECETPDCKMTARDVMIPDPITAFPGEPVDLVFKRMRDNFIGIAPVIRGPEDRKIVGVVTYRNIFEAYEKALLD